MGLRGDAGRGLYGAALLHIGRLAEQAVNEVNVQEGALLR